jgi:adenosylcobinamide-GDP ribazoletransferase
MLRGLITAVRTLTVLPVPGHDAEKMASSLPWFPLVGFMLGGFLYVIARLIGLIADNDWPQGAAMVLTGCGILLTKGLHLDGLADWADAFGNLHDKNKTLAIMKDSHIGAFGATAIAFILLAKWIFLTRIIDSGSLNCIISASIVSRTMQAELATTLPYARAEEGIAAPFVRGARFHHRCIAITSALAMLALLNGLAGLIMVAVGWIACKGFGLWSKKRIGGVTGDVLGACSELIETLTLFLCALLGKTITGLYFF